MKKRFISLMLAISLIAGMLTFTSSVSAQSFDDVKADDWFASYVGEICESKIMKGTSDTKFSPKSNTKRGDFVLMLYRYAGEPAVKGSNPFADVARDDYFYNAVR